MTHPYRDASLAITPEQVWLTAYTQWIDKHAHRDDLTFTWKMRSAEDAARQATESYVRAFFP